MRDNRGPNTAGNDVLQTKKGSIWTSVISHVGMNTLVILANVIVEVYNLPVK